MRVALSFSLHRVPVRRRRGLPGVVFAAVDRLGEEPRPEGAFGGTDVLRIHVGVYRVMYEITDQQVRVSVVHLGRLR